MKRLRDAWLVLIGKALVVRGTGFTGSIVHGPGITFGTSTLGFFGTDQKES